MRYVLTHEQYNQALTIGAAQLGILPHDTAYESIFAEVVENGALIDVPDADSKPAPERAASAPARVAPVTRAAAAEKAKEGPSETVVAKIREGLAGLMTRAPSVATIRTWDKKQIRAAKEWITTKENGGTQERPDFIVEPKARVRGGAAETSTPANGVATSKSDNSDFFSSDDDAEEAAT